MSERNATVRGREIGKQLRAHREAAGLRQYQAARRLGVSTASMCRTEDGTRIPHPEEVAALLMLYRVSGPERDTLLAITREVADQGWWQRHNPEAITRLNTLTTLESQAVTITSFQIAVVPGLLQSPLYTEALMRDVGRVPPAEIGPRVTSRVARRRVLFKNKPAHFLAVLEESVLHRYPGSAAVMHRQLDYLRHLADQPNITIRIVPTAKSTRVIEIDGFHLMRFGKNPAVVHTENWGSELYYEDPASLELYDDGVRRLSEVALDKEESVELITRLMHELEDDPDVRPHIGFPRVAEEQLQQQPQFGVRGDRVHR